MVYAIKSDSHEIASPVHGEQKILSATIENIIADKLVACHRYKSGNTRMKDFDDLWRLSQSGVSVRRTRLKTLLKPYGVLAKIDPEWIFSDLESAWSAHRSRYPDLPENLEELFTAVNKWLGSPGGARRK